MANDEMLKKIESLIEYEALIEELQKEAKVLEDSIKEEMVERDVEEFEIGTHIVRFTSVSSSRFDTKRFKAELGEELYKKYCKEVASRRFSIA